eukprot:1161655-Pelagomonas_calceolata.AAC.10
MVGEVEAGGEVGELGLTGRAALPFGASLRLPGHTCIMKCIQEKVMHAHDRPVDTPYYKPARIEKIAME